LKKTLLLSIAFCCTLLHSQSVRNYSNEFMNIGVDAAALAMSNTAVSYTDDVNSVYWNPAGLLNLTDHQVALMHASYFGNIAQYDYLAYAKPIDNYSAWGISAIRFGVDNILNTTQLIDSEGNIDYSRISLFSTADYGFTFSYAKKSKVKDLQFGVNAKVIRRVIGNFANSWGFGFDAGIQYRKNNWNYGVMVRDLTTTYNVWSIDEAEYQKIADAVDGQNQEMPESTEITAPKAQLGVSKSFVYNYDYSFLAAFNLNMRFAKTNDIISSNSVSIEPAAGFEFGYLNMIFVRTGVGNFQNNLQVDGNTSLSFQPNIGLGFVYKGISVDYALTNLAKQNTTLYSNIFSLKIDLKQFR
jgi:hypothetical protein